MNVFSVNNPGSCEYHFGISKRKAGKFKLEWDSNPFLCDADVVLCQLSDIALTSYKKSLDHNYSKMATNYSCLFNANHPN